MFTLNFISNVVRKSKEDNESNLKSVTPVETFKVDCSRVTFRVRSLPDSSVDGLFIEKKNKIGKKL